MTEADYNNKIAAQSQTISNYNQQIGELEDKISELKAMLKKLNKLSENLETVSGGALRKVQGLPQIFGAVVSAVKLDFFSGITEVIGGKKKTAALSGVEEAKRKVQNQINQYESEIENKRNAIRSCNQKISSLKTQKNNLKNEKET